MSQIKIDVLSYVEENKNLTQAEIAEKFDISIGSVNKFLNDKTINLDDHKVENAILFAAGWGSRMSPITDTTPKPLVDIKGIPFIEYILEQVVNIGVKNIYIVVGKFKEKFDYLVDKYGVQIIENPDWSTRNNISSLFYSQNITGNTLYFECDQILNDKALRKHYYVSSFHGTWRDETNPEDRYYLNGNQVINIKKSIEPGYYWNGIVFINKHDQELLINYCNAVYDKPKYVDMLWEKLLLELSANRKIKMSLIEMQEGDALEFDTVEEIAHYDDKYMPIYLEMKQAHDKAIEKLKK